MHQEEMISFFSATESLSFSQFSADSQSQSPYSTSVVQWFAIRANNLTEMYRRKKLVFLVVSGI